MSKTDKNEILTLPKAELHIHLEGCVDQETLHILAERNKVDLLADTTFPQGIRIPAPAANNLVFPFQGNFKNFINLYVKISECIQTADDIELIARRYCQSATQQNITYSEMYVTPTTLTALQCPEETLFNGLLQAQFLAEHDYRHRIRWIFDIVRNINGDGAETLSIALKARDKGINVIALGLAGLEDGYSCLPFAETFKKARTLGFKVLAHAGETAGVKSIWKTIQHLQPDRIGHGIRALEDKSLVEYLVKRDIPIEVCPWSNINLEICTEENHPVKQMIGSGLNIVIASDDPGIFKKSLSENYMYLLEKGISIEQIRELARRSLEWISLL